MSRVTAKVHVVFDDIENVDVARLAEMSGAVMVVACDAAKQARGYADALRGIVEAADDGVDPVKTVWRMRDVAAKALEENES